MRSPFAGLLGATILLAAMASPAWGCLNDREVKELESIKSHTERSSGLSSSACAALARSAIIVRPTPRRPRAPWDRLRTFQEAA